MTGGKIEYKLKNWTIHVSTSEFNYSRIAVVFIFQRRMEFHVTNTIFQVKYTRTSKQW